MIYQELHELADLYALDALEQAETAEFEEHLRKCGQCVERVAASLTVTAALVEDTGPPNHVWDRIVQELEQPPLATVVQLPRRRRILTQLASVAAVAAIGLLAVLISQDTVPGEAIAAAAAVAADQPGSTVADFVVDDVVVAQVVLTEAGAGFVIPTAELPDLETSRTYQLWVINEDGGVISGGVLGNAPEISTFTWTDGVSGFALTREVAGGVAVSEGDVVAVSDV